MRFFFHTEDVGDGRRHFGRHGQRWHTGHPGWDDEGGIRRGRRRVFDSAELRLVLLKLLQDEPRHGYDLIRAVEDLTGGAYSPSPGVVYPTLTLLQEMGHTRENEPGGSRKSYSVTPEGSAFLEEQKKEVEALFARLKEMAAARQQFDGAPIRRAMHNLRAVLMHRLGQEKTAPETVHAVTAILDDAAQQIERL